MEKKERHHVVAMPDDLLPVTADLVVRFASAVAHKLASAQKKYGHTDGWLSADWLDECREHLAKHVEKGDPRDVAAYCAFLWHHGEATSQEAQGRREKLLLEIHERHTRHSREALP